MTSFTPQPSYLLRHSCRYPMNRRLDEPHSRFGRFRYEKSLGPVGIRSPDRPAHEDQPLYRLQYTQSCFCYHSFQLYTLHRPLLTIFSRHRHAIMSINTCKPIFRKLHTSNGWLQNSKVEIPRAIEIWITLSRVLTTEHTQNNTAAVW